MDSLKIKLTGLDFGVLIHYYKRLLIRWTNYNRPYLEEIYRMPLNILAPSFLIFFEYVYQLTY